MHRFRMSAFHLVTASIILLAAAPPGHARVLQVPSDYPSINAAIAAAVDGDTVRVAPGTYRENVDFLGKAIVLTSHLGPGRDWSVVESTVIVGSAPADPTVASTVLFRSGEDRRSVLQGFTISGGAGTVWVDPQFPEYSWRGGGGIFCFRSSPTIRCNLITGNRVENTGEVDGAQAGGLITYGGHPLVEHNLITRNQAEYGGGLVVDYSAATVRNTIISHNIGGDSYGGGGVWTIGNGDGETLFENCSIVFNSSPTRGGALYLWSSTVRLRNSILWGNEQSVGGPVAGTGGGKALISYSLVEGGYEGTGNLDAEPLFRAAATCVLAPESPGVDAGDPDPEHDDRADPLLPGLARWPARGGLRNDMGANGGPSCTYLGEMIGPPFWAQRGHAAEH